MKLSTYAKKLGITYKTAWNWFKQGKLDAYQMGTGTIIVNEEKEAEKQKKTKRIAIYGRVSSSENKKNLEKQVERLKDYCGAKGYKISKVCSEVGSGINDKRPKFLSLLKDKNIDIIVVEHKDRSTRFGFNYIQTLLSLQERRIEIINEVENGKGEDLMQDFISIITSFCAKIYGQRRSKRKTEKIIEELKNKK